VDCRLTKEAGLANVHCIHKPVSPTPMPRVLGPERYEHGFLNASDPTASPELARRLFHIWGREEMKIWLDPDKYTQSFAVMPEPMKAKIMPRSTATAVAIKRLWVEAQGEFDTRSGQ